MKAIGWMLIIVVLVILFVVSGVVIGFKAALCIWGVAALLSILLVAGMNLADKD